MKALSKQEAVELVSWSDQVFKQAVASANSNWNLVAKFLMPRASGEDILLFATLMKEAWNVLIETLTHDEFMWFQLARDYGVLLDYDKEHGGFDSMAEAYAAGVPLEDIIV